MKHILLFFLLLLMNTAAYAQMGKTKAELLALYGKEKVMKESEGRPGYTGILFRVDSSSFLQATFNADVAVMLSFIHTDMYLSEQQYSSYINQNLPGFTPQQSCILGNKTFLLNADNTVLVVQNHRQDSTDFPITGLIMVTDPAIIKSMADKIEEYCQ
ncbi:hypothetical protein D770_25490 [Flammeovirgaceae bacterium 311]|nr:hypothetical protein D770_25490 [Flammeovirgaceae bacterium 311]